MKFPPGNDVAHCRIVADRSAIARERHHKSLAAAFDTSTPLPLVAEQRWKLTSTTLFRNTRVRKNGTATLQFRSSPADALGQITVNQILTAEYSEFDFTLSSGKVVHNYLQQSRVQSPVQFPGATTTGRK